MINKRWIIIVPVLVILISRSYSQDEGFISIHQQQSEYYNSRPWPGADKVKTEFDYSKDCKLEKLVFGYHPYWTGDAYLNYRWNLLSDLCYFSYEVDPGTGEANTIHDWLSAPVIDSAKSNGVRTHLCVTLFSGHSLFFNTPSAQAKLIENLIDLVMQRDADGVSLDFEAIPPSQGEAFITYSVELASQIHEAIPGCLVSMAIPAVDWHGTFNIDLLSESIDLFMVMGYDYYWNGSGMAGPVSPLYPMTSGYNQGLAKTITTYLTNGLPRNKFLLGIPYYARQWATAGKTAPSNVTAYGKAYTYANIKNSSAGPYNDENRYWEPASFSTYYSFFINDSWYQCFLCESRDLKERYDQVNYQDLAGIGIWALGYDNGYSGLWNLLENCFTDCSPGMLADTIYDSGGPYWNYYNDEDYTLLVRSGDSSVIELDFIDLNLENDVDILSIYDGKDSSYPLIGTYTGYDLPGIVNPSGSEVLLHFISDPGSTGGGWGIKWYRASTHDVAENTALNNEMRIVPNPALDMIRISGHDDQDIVSVSVYDTGNRLVYKSEPVNGNDEVIISVRSLIPGLYVVSVEAADGQSYLLKLVVAHR